MIEINVVENEIYIPSSNKFMVIPSCTLILEHSLMSVAKWESKWHKPYLTGKKKSYEEELDYIRCMVVGPIKNEYVFGILSSENLIQIRNYIDDPMTATTFSKNNRSVSKEIITAEIIYYRMFNNNIPLECQKWHLNRLLTLIRVCDNKSGPVSKMNKKQTSQYYAEQNALRRQKYNNRG